MFFKVLYMETQNYLQDLKEIKELMNKSSQFISLSGYRNLSGYICPLSGAVIAYFLIEQHTEYYITFRKPYIQIDYSNSCLCINSFSNNFIYFNG